MTRRRWAELNRHTFADARFLERLDVGFAGLFFAALDEFERAPAGAPHAWLPLFTQRAKKGVAPLQFALAGMNAHINRDLPVALVATCRELGIDLREGSPEQGDYVQVNAVLAAWRRASNGRSSPAGSRSPTGSCIASIASTTCRDVGHRARPGCRVDERARALEAARRRRPEREFLLTLDRMVGLGSRGLMIPADTALQKLGRVFSR